MENEVINPVVEGQVEEPVVEPVVENTEPVVETPVEPVAEPAPAVEEVEPATDDTFAASDVDEGNQDPVPEGAVEETPEGDGENNFAKKKEEDCKNDGEESDGNSDDQDDDEEKKKDFELLQEKYSTLVSDFEELKVKYDELVAFKAEIEDAKKDEMIGKFYFLSDEDKKEVVENKSKYTVEEIESKLSVICVRNKVNFNLDNNDKTDIKIEEAPVTTFSLNVTGESIPAWISAVKNNQKNN